MEKSAPASSAAAPVLPEHHPRKSWQRRKHARPSELLDAALAEFAANGFEGAHMEAIARRADVTKGTIYLYFHSKETLFAALVRERIGIVLAGEAERVLSLAAAPEEKLQAFFAAIGAALAEPSRNALLKVLFAEGERFAPLAALYLSEVVQPISACLSAIGGANDFYRLPADHIAQLCVAPALLARLHTPASAMPHPAEAGGVAAAQLNVVLRGCLVAGGTAVPA